MRSDPDFSPAVLQDWIVQGAEQGDAVRLHGALTAALTLYRRADAYAWVFAPALERLEGEAWQRARDGINAQLLQAWQRRSAA